MAAPEFMDYALKDSKEKGWRKRILQRVMRISPTPSVIMPTTHWRCQLGQSQKLGQRSLKKLKEALNGLVKNIWSKMDLEGLRTFKEHEG